MSSLPLGWKPDFTNNVGLQAMRNAWRERHEHFDQDRAAAYDVADAIAEAEAHIDIYDRLYPTGEVEIRRPCGPRSVYDSPQGFSGTPVGGADLPRDDIGELRKVCGMCHRPSRNNPCDECYQKFREVQDPNWGFGMNPKFCVVCFDDADEQGKLCATCRALLEGRAPE